MSMGFRRSSGNSPAGSPGSPGDLCPAPSCRACERRVQRPTALRRGRETRSANGNLPRRRYRSGSVAGHVAPCAASPSAAVLAAAKVETIQVQRQIKSLGETWFQGGWVEPMERIAAPQGVLLRQQHSVAETACGMARLGPRGTTHRTACSIPMEINTIVGLAAAFCTTISYFPQLKKCWVTGSAGDLSLKMFSILATGIALWVTYGVLQGDFVIIVELRSADHSPHGRGRAEAFEAAEIPDA